MTQLNRINLDQRRLLPLDEMDTGADVDTLMQASDTLLVDFFDWAGDQGSMAIAKVDDFDEECARLQMVVALLRGNTALATRLAERYREPLRESASEAIKAACKRNESPWDDEYLP